MAGPIRIAILANARDAVKAFRDTSRESKKMTDKVKADFKSIRGPALGVFGGIAVGAFQAGQSASELSDAIDASKIVLGSAQGEVAKFANDAAKNFGLSKQSVFDAANAVGTFGKAAGLQGPQLADFTTSLIGRAGDAAAMLGGTAKEAVEAFGSALRGEFEPIRRYGVLLDAASVSAEAVSSGLVKNVKNTDKIRDAQVAVLAAQAKLKKLGAGGAPDAGKVKTAQLAVATAQAKVDKTNRSAKASDLDRAKAQDALAKAQTNLAKVRSGPSTIETLKAQNDLAKAQTRLKAAVTGSVPPLTAQQKTLATQQLILKQTAQAQDNFANTADSTKGRQEKLKAEFANTSAELGTQLLPLMSEAADKLSLIVAWAGKNRDTVRNLVLTLGGLALGVLAVNAAISVATAIQAAWNFGVLIAGWVKLGAAALVNSAKVVAGWAAQAAAAVVDVAIIIGSYAALGASAVASAALVVAGWVASGAAALAAAAQIALAWVISLGPIALVIIAIVAVVAVIVLLWKKCETFRRVVTKAFKATWDFIVLRFKVGMAGLKEIWGGLVWLYNKAVDFHNKIVGVIHGVAQKFMNVGRDIMRGLSDGITKGIQWVKDKVKGLGKLLPNWLRDVLGIRSPSRVMADVGKNVMLGLNRGMQSQVPALRAQLKGVSTTIRKDMVRWGDVSSAEWDRLLKSGWKGRAGDNMEALYRPIAVQPAANAGGDVHLHFNIPATVDHAKVGKQITDAIKAYERQSGKRILVTT